MCGKQIVALTLVAAGADIAISMRTLIDHEEPLPHPACDQAATASQDHQRNPGVLIAGAVVGSIINNRRRDHKLPKVEPPDQWFD
jgi:methyl coenzyme M reductase subunit C-like uncharacterized protein (methanogenesis marker protein 7)